MPEQRSGLCGITRGLLLSPGAGFPVCSPCVCAFVLAKCKLEVSVPIQPMLRFDSLGYRGERNKQYALLRRGRENAEKQIEHR